MVAAVTYLVLAALPAPPAGGTIALRRLTPITAEPGTKTESSVAMPPNRALVPAHCSRRDGSTTATKSSKCEGRKDGR